MSWETAFQNHIGLPLGMRSSSYVCAFAGSTAEHPHPAIGMCTTNSDLAAFTSMMMRSGEALDGTVVLTPASTQAILSAQTGHARLLHDDLHAFAINLQTLCVSPSNDSLIGYGLGAFEILGFKFQAWMHPGLMGVLNWLVPGRYAMVFSAHFPIELEESRLYRAIWAFEEANWPGYEMCPTSVKGPKLEYDKPWSQPGLFPPWQYEHPSF